MPANAPSLKEVFLAALAIAPPERAAWLEQTCGQEAELRRRVELMLTAHDSPQSLLDRSVAAPDRFEASISPRGSAMSGEPGTVIGPYKLLQQIGEGGMGKVWMAQQNEPVKRLVALKLIKAEIDSRQVIARFEAERQALALMDHPNIARVLDAGTTAAGRPYFVMDLVKGVPITKYCDEHHLTPRQRLELFIPVCEAVQHAHQKGIIHRDLKPSNVLVALYDGKPVPKVIDFGVAKATGRTLTEKTLVTDFGAIVGTLEYMSPEQAEINQLDIDTRADIYSLGAMLYELLTGSLPFSRQELQAAAFLEMLRMIKEVEPPKPSTRLSGLGTLASVAAVRQTKPKQLIALIRGELDWIIVKCLEKNRARRYESASGLALDVQRYLANEPVQACPPSRWYRFHKYMRKYKKVVFAVGAFAALLVTATVISLALASWAMRERNAAEVQKQLAEASFKKALEAVDQMLTRVGENRLTDVPQMDSTRRDLLKDALRFYQEFLKERGDSPAVRSEAARAYKRVGQIQVSLGQQDEGEQAYGQAAALLEKLRDESPNDPSLCSELGEIHDALGLLYQNSTKRWPLAEASFQRGVALLRQQNSDPLMPRKSRYMLGRIHNSQVIFYRQTGDLDKAVTAFIECKTVAEKLLAADSKDIKALTLLAMCHVNVAFVYNAKERTADAEAAHLKALDLYEQLSRDEPQDQNSRLGLASTHNNLGVFYTQTRQDDKAEKHLQQSLTLHKALFDDHPKVVLCQLELAGSYSSMSTYVRRTRSAEASLEWSARAIDTLEALLKQEPRESYGRFALFDALMGRGYAFVNLKRQEDAVRDWRRMLEISEGQPDIRMRIYRPYALIFLGEHAPATAEIETLIAQGHVQGRNPLLFAKVHSLSSAAAATDARLSPAEQQRLADKYGGRAVELLRMAQTAGFFKDPRQLPQLKENKELKSIREREDFKQLVAEVEAKKE